MSCNAQELFLFPHIAVCFTFPCLAIGDGKGFDWGEQVFLVEFAHKFALFIKDETDYIKPRLTNFF